MLPIFVKFMTHVFLSNIDYKRRKEINHLVVTTRKFKPTAFFFIWSQREVHWINLGRICLKPSKLETTSVAGVVAWNMIIQKPFASPRLQTASEQLLLHCIGLSSHSLPVFLSLRLAHNVVCFALRWLVYLPNCLRKKARKWEKRNPYLIQKDFGFFWRQHAQAGGGS